MLCINKDPPYSIAGKKIKILPSKKSNETSARMCLFLYLISNNSVVVVQLYL
jgi:hypothetical protein